jgi:hypothetical protein
MNLRNLKKLTVTGTLSLITLLGISGVANAQESRWERRQRIEQQRRYEEQQRQQQQQQYYEQQRRRQIEQERYNSSRDGQYRNNGYYNDNGYNNNSRRIEILRQAVNRGYQQGYRAGRRERSNRGSYDYNNQSMYRSGNYGYQRSVDASEYRYYFQQGFQRGYEDGYYSRNQYGRNGTSILGAILNGIFNNR